MNQYPTRVLVTGKYLNASTYVLLNEDGSEFMTLREGEGFKIDNQFRPWYPVRVPHKSGKGTILMCKKFGNSGNVIEQFPLIHNKRGLWAITSGAARNGVFHNYHEPKTELERLLVSLRISKQVLETVSNIDVELKISVPESLYHLPGHACISDGKCKVVNLIGDTDYVARIYDATYVIYYLTDRYNHVYVEKILVTPNAKESEIIKLLSTLR